MKIKRISITNIKSFNTKTSIEFDSEFNIIIGPNASGKSNLLDITTICLQNFFLHNYGEQIDSGRKHITSSVTFQNINQLLQKYIGNSTPSEIEFEFIVKKEDLDNIRMFREEAKNFIHFLTAYSSSNEILIRQFEEIDWDEESFTEGNTFSYKILNNSLNFNNQLTIFHKNIDEELEAQRIREITFLRYLNFLQLFSKYSHHFTTKEIKPLFLFLSPYRGGNDGNAFEGNLSNTSSSVIIQGFKTTTSKQTISLINLATVYFAEKMRRFETTAKISGYQELWDNDVEVILVSKYLKKLGYQWNLNLKDANKNIYEINLIKEGVLLSLSQASSGEKEIINYLFGIFALKITNGLIIIDEPELHLHPRWQLLLLDLFIELTQQTGNQFFITTHSAVFINVNSVTNLIRLYRKDRESKHVSLKEKANTDLKDLLHLVNSTNNEKIFFSDYVILVEGISDRLVFQKITSLILALHNVLSVVEVVEINGKGNIKKFRQYLKLLEIPYYFIADLDYVNQVGTTELKDLFITSLGDIDNNAIKNPKSSDGKKLIEILESAVDSNDLGKVQEFIEYLKSHRRKIKQNLSTDEKNKLYAFIESRHSQKEYILPLGDIEKYFPKGLSAKDLDNVIELLKEPKFLEWQSTDQYNDLENIIVGIFKDAGLIS